MNGEQQSLSLCPGDALVLVDVQNDFLPGGPLAVPGGDQVVPVLNEYLRRFVKRGLPVFAIRDWHPADHCSFQASGGPWPPHCIAGTVGARFSPELSLPPYTRVISKATARAPDCHSGFTGTDLVRRLHQAGVKRVFVGGLATDSSILNTVKDAIELGFTTVLLLDGMRAVDTHPGGAAAAIAEMQRLGALTGRVADRGG